MPHQLQDFGLSSVRTVLAIGEPPDIPWYQSELFVFVPIVILFFAGLLLGYILFKPHGEPAKEKESAENPGEEGGDGQISEEQSAQIREELEADFERSRAGLQGEMDAAELLISQQKSEIQNRDEKLADSQTQVAEKERRLTELAALTKKESQGTGNKTAWAHAKASVIQLSETINSQRQQIGSGISRLEQIEDRVKFQTDKVWEGVNEFGKLQTDAAAKGGWRKKDLVAVLKDLEDHLRVHHQNATGCIQQAGEARKRLQTRQDLLKNARQPVICVEKRIDEIEAVGDKTPAAEFKDAAEELRLSRALVADLDSGVQGEIAELDGRVDWLLNDSSKKFVSSHDALKEVKQPRNKDLRHDLNLTERKLSEIRTLLTRTTETAPAAASDAFTGPITPRRRINPAFDEAILALQTAAVTPAIPEPAEQPPAIDTTKFESELESLRNQLSEEKTGTESLRQSLTENQSLLEELEARAAAAEANQSAPLQASTGSDLMRRLLRLGPNRREEALQSQAASTALAAESSGYEDGMTGPQMSINELKAIAEKVETSPINGHDQEDDEEVESLRESITERDEKISELESEIRQLTAPIPFPSELRTDEELRASNYAPAVVPGPTILPLTPSEFEPADELNESDASIPIPLPGDIAAEKEPASVLIFRGDDPAIWNSDFHDARGNFALPLDQLPQEIESIRVKRLDTDEFVETPVTRKTLLAGGTKNESRGWSGKGEHYFGSMHLGIFDESLSHDVETKFGSGGWGFGHRYEISSGQAFAWEGKEIPSVRFEITVRTRGTETSSTTQQGIVDDSTGLSRIEEKPTLPDDGLIVFRSNDPTMWNQNAYLGANLRARSLDGLPDGINWLKMTRCDTGESIFARTELDQLRGDGNGAVSGFNGSNELFYGAHHLGVFDGSAKLDVETRFTFGGWGFGHRNSTTDEESQACGWGGEEIAADTVFEIRLFSELPDIGENESVIGGAK